MPEATYVQPGRTIDYTAGADIAVGEVVVIGTIAGVAERAIANGAIGSVSIEGVYDVAKQSGVAVTAGALVYFVAASNYVNVTSSGNTLMGTAIADAAAGDATVRVKLHR